MWKIFTDEFEIIVITRRLLLAQIMLLMTILAHYLSRMIANGKPTKNTYKPDSAGSQTIL